MAKTFLRFKTEYDMLLFISGYNNNIDMANNVLNIPKGHSFEISSIDLEYSIIERLFALGIRIGSVVKVIGHYSRKVLILIAGELQIVLDKRIAEKIFIK